MRLGGVAGADEVVSKGVHEVQEAGGAVWVPPCGGEGIEVGDFGGGDGRAGGGGRVSRLEVALDRAGGGAEEEGEVAEGGGVEDGG